MSHGGWSLDFSNTPTTPHLPETVPPAPPPAHLRLSNGEVSFDGFQHGPPRSRGISGCNRLPIQVEQDGQKVLGKAAHFGTIGLWQKDQSLHKRGRT